MYIMYDFFFFEYTLRKSKSKIFKNQGYHLPQIFYFFGLGHNLLASNHQH